LAEPGYVEGKNLELVVRTTDNQELQAEYATELARLRLDCLVSTGASVTRTMKEAADAANSPLVAVNFGDPVAAGWVASLAWPGGNLTGVTFDNSKLDQKRMEIFKEAVPNLQRVGVLWEPATPAAGTVALRLRGFYEAGNAAGMEVVSLEVRSGDVSRALDEVGGASLDGLYVAQGAIFNNQRAQLVSFAAEQRLPALYSSSLFGPSGGLLSVGVSTAALHRRAAALVDRVLRGTSPGEIPIELATSVELVVNLNTARDLGLTIPQSILLQATEVIE
jgi:putative ABC transport system substrate-binding protein